MKYLSNKVLTVKFFNLFVVYLLLFIICCNPKEKKIEIVDNENAADWLSITIPKRQNGMLNHYEEIPYVIMNNNYISFYIKTLQEKQFHILNDEEYFFLTGQLLKKKYGLAIRGVYSYPICDFTIIRINKNEYLILNIGDLFDFKKTVLIIELDELPENIFVRVAARA